MQQLILTLKAAFGGHFVTFKLCVFRDISDDVDVGEKSNGTLRDIY